MGLNGKGQSLQTLALNGDAGLVGVGGNAGDGHLDDRSRLGESFARNELAEAFA
jgi:hypothetical protein